MKKEYIKIKDYAGIFAENKDKAKELRISKITPALSNRKMLVLDFDGVSGATQSFVHALISEPIRQFQNLALDNLEYKNCSEIVKEIIKTVYDYMQESLDDK
ncbi:MAG: hypothetical protein US83_C0002G0098 [Candidatus Falkowbacteria bacterium GW2011_GWC2_38_22]|uniref:DUF4325 domain-containing protein n=1 Tax=Candidatus Falkowbacteria bacterium GW2011_GWE1_38_31 TaxID=1618638 RepID=A0A0G0MAC6_9BACT|nr:MAG: hypothetical protein US73_C0007G0098 [Candidatus Falkowbacteria bacterium GW2011_GWF2_38_1205]KKQ62009.1 MAG: hypothetical protein US83_C0002G0098 [Candidatus Falkowbacteria bacterium GW2011_GWC2_38_22]KKQ63829.1 MAG: hypothetical protein US84_C0003G0019 [Candidatus Falkowbacteria bacterium GW2011_GWF1_38_22]KKQ66086.1 MAG: hypothetical protein US87_C0003G0019 [Candidatus Falkowbacteria bacterium GW2011_GWE2_38_254]KKQ70689.1 MAG: hypothetical protein US91_C0003G0019 [Candidatus Falkowb